MPYIHLNKKQVIFDDEDSRQVVIVLKKMLADKGFSMEEDNSASSKSQTSTKAPIKKELRSEAKKMLAAIFGSLLGGEISEQDIKELPECKINMDGGAHLLFQAYQNHWTSMMRSANRYTATQLIEEKIGDSNILIMELYLRWAAQMLCSDSDNFSNQDRQVFRSVLSDFSTQLSKNLFLNNPLQKNLFKEHKSWLDGLIKTIDQIYQLNKARGIVGETVDYLEKLYKKTARYLVLLLEKGREEKNLNMSWKGKLADSQIQHTCFESEEKILKQKRSSEAENRSIDEKIKTSIVAYKASSEMQSNIICKVLDLVSVEIITEQEMLRQNEVISHVKEAKIKEIYALLNKVKIVVQFANQVNALMGSLGSLPIVFGVIELSEVERVVSEIKTMCEEEFTLLLQEQDETFLDASLKSEFDQSPAIRRRKTLPINLNQTEIPVLLETVCLRMVFDFERLKKLGEFLGCKVTRNPFLAKATENKSMDVATPPKSPRGGTPTFFTPTFISASAGARPRSLSQFENVATRSASSLTGNQIEKTRVLQKHRKQKTMTFITLDSSPTKERPGSTSEPSLGQINFSPTRNLQSIEDKKKQHRILVEAEEPESSNLEIPSSSHVLKAVNVSPKKASFKTNILYIQIFMKGICDLSEDEVKETVMRFDSQPTYFNNPKISAFCRRVNRIIRYFCSKLEAQRPSDFMGGITWSQRQEEVTVLKYLCIKAAELRNDSHLLNFISTMVNCMTDALIWWRYNILRVRLEDVLSLQREGKIESFAVFKVGLRLSSEVQEVQDENIELQKKYQALEQQYKAVQLENTALKSENEKLQKLAIGSQNAPVLQQVKKVLPLLLPEKTRDEEDNKAEPLLHCVLL